MKVLDKIHGSQEGGIAWKPFQNFSGSSEFCLDLGDKGEYAFQKQLLKELWYYHSLDTHKFEDDREWLKALYPTSFY